MTTPHARRRGRVYDSSAQPGSIWSLACHVCLTLLAAFPYVGQLSGPFLFDDQQAIVDNETLAPFQVWRALSPPRETPVAARPVVNLAFAIDGALRGLTPHTLHTTNLVLHVACTLLGFAALRRILRRPRLPEPIRRHATAHAFISAAVFGVHPMTSEIVLYATQRSESIMALCYLGSAWLLLLELPDRRVWPWALALSLLGIGAKEVYATAPVVLLALDRAFVSGSARAALTQRPRLYAALTSCWIPALLLQLSGPRSDSVHAFTLDYLLAQARIVPGYFGHALWPGRPPLDYGQLWPQPWADAWPWLALSTCASLAGLAVAWRRPQGGFVALWTLLILAPSSSVLSIHTEVGAERRFYLPLLGLLATAIVACSLGLQQLSPLRKRYAARRIGFTVGVTVALLLAARTRGYAEAWGSVPTFWQAAVEARPESARAHYNLAESQRRQGQVDSAIAAYRAALNVQEGYGEAHSNLAALLIARGELAQGLVHAQRSVELAPRDPVTHYNLAVALALSGETARALAALEETLQLEPSHWDAHRKLAQAYLLMGQPKAAEAHARQLLAHAPGDPLAQRVLGQLARSATP